MPTSGTSYVPSGRVRPSEDDTTDLEDRALGKILSETVSTSHHRSVPGADLEGGHSTERMSRRRLMPYATAATIAGLGAGLISPAWSTPVSADYTCVTQNGVKIDAYSQIGNSQFAYGSLINWNSGCTSSVSRTFYIQEEQLQWNSGTPFYCDNSSSIVDTFTNAELPFNWNLCVTNKDYSNLNILNVYHGGWGDYIGYDSGPKYY
jgi:hypothetical protein